MKRLLIIDGNALVHRAFHALPKLTNSQGEMTNAVYGFFSIFIRTVRDLSPDFICACFDLPGPTFRHKQFKQYKATRPKYSEDLYSQIPRIKGILKQLCVPVFEKQGFEADDLIATIARTPDVEAIESVILSGDKDVLQLVDDNTKASLPVKGMNNTILYDEQMVKEKYQLSPIQIVDLKGLQGDSSDNIPGVPGIGVKTGTDLLIKFETLENIYKNIESEKIKPRIKQLLIDNKEQAFLSKQLAEVKQDVEIDFVLDNCIWKGYNKTGLESLENYKFFSLIKRISEKHKEKEKQQNKLF